jgi:hypothetical protein
MVHVDSIAEIVVVYAAAKLNAWSPEDQTVNIIIG